MRLEPTKLILIGTRTTYQATGECQHMACTIDHQPGIARLPPHGTDVLNMTTQISVLYKLTGGGGLLPYTLVRNSELVFSTTGKGHSPSDAPTEISRRDLPNATIFVLYAPLVLEISTWKISPGCALCYCVSYDKFMGSFTAQIWRENISASSRMQKKCMHTEPGTSTYNTSATSARISRRNTYLAARSSTTKFVPGSSTFQLRNIFAKRERSNARQHIETTSCDSRTWRDVCE